MSKVRIRASDQITPYDEQRRVHRTIDSSRQVKREHLRTRARVLTAITADTLDELYEVDPEAARWELDSLSKRTDALYLRIVKRDRQTSVITERGVE